jgi:hypothetical protein
MDQEGAPRRKASEKVDTPKPYDPLDYTNLAANVVSALIARDMGRIPPEARFAGSGVYAIYYLGESEYYRSFTGPERPIYAGCAVPAGKRKGGGVTQEDGRALSARLEQHARSIHQAHNLDLRDFRCRYLVTVAVWTPLAERFLIEHYHPIWNTVVDGFGNHDPGKGRHAMKRPRWDILHPGRPWAALLPPAETVEEILADLTRRGAL